MKRLLVVSLISLVLISSSAQNSHAVKDSWIAVRSKNFFLVGNTSEKEIRQVALKLEQFREAFSQLFPKMRFASPVPTTVVVFKSASSYRPFRPGPTTSGYFQAGPDVNYIALTTELRGEHDAFDVIFHEYTHLLVDNTIDDAPAWFNEGLAEYYSTFSISNDQKIELGNPITSHIVALRQNNLLPLRTLFTVDHKSPYYNESNKKSIFYAQSWALMHYLVLNKNAQRTAQAAKFIQLTNGKVPLEQAFTQAFQMSFEDMENDLRQYVRQDRFRVMQARFERKLETDNTLETLPLTEAEAQAYLGDLLAHSNKKEAESYLQKALELDPNLALAHTSLGMLRFREGNIEEARKSLERAVSFNSQNYLAHYYYAYTLSRTTPEDQISASGYSSDLIAKMREHLRKAIALRPDFSEPYNLMAFVSLLAGNEIDESLEALKGQLRIHPGRNDFKYMLAQLYARKDDYKTARDLLEQVLKTSNDDELSHRAQSLSRQLADMEERMQRFKNADSAFADELDVRDESSLLRLVLRQPATDESRQQGRLVLIECAPKGIVFVVKTEKGLLRLTAATFKNAQFKTYNRDVQGYLTCGPRRAEEPVVVCYSATQHQQSDGILRSIEFVPDGFLLKP